MALSNECGLPHYGKTLIALAPSLIGWGITLENMKMAYKNIAARLITINTPDGKSYPIAPDETVEVESELGVAKDFVDSLIDSKQLEKVASQKQEKKDESKEAKK